LIETCGAIGVNLVEFWQSSPQEFLSKLDGWIQANNPSKTADLSEEDVKARRQRLEEKRRKRKRAERNAKRSRQPNA
jgi:hypothetical protein